MKTAPFADAGMALLDTAVVSLHLLFAALWAGGVVFVTVAILPLARDGTMAPGPLGTVTDRLVWLSRLSALVLLLTGGHMAGTFYTAESLTGTTRGHLVLGMVVLWLVLAALVEVGGRELTDGTAREKVREPARDARPYLLAATVVALALLVDGGLLAGGFP